MLRKLTDYATDEIIEVLVDVDAIFSGLDSAPNMTHMMCPTFNEVGTPLPEAAILELECGKPHYVYVNQYGSIAWRFKVVDLEGDPINLGYAGFDSIGLEDQFPQVAKAVEAYLLREHGADLTDLWRATSRRFARKPQMIDLANEQINHGRKMRACNLLEEEGEARDTFYERQDDFGQF